MSYEWRGLHLSRSLRPSATFSTPSGHIKEIPLTDRHLLQIIRDASHALGQRDDARSMISNRDGVSLETSLRIGLDVEEENPDADTPRLTDRQIKWISDWLTGEGFHK